MVLFSAMAERLTTERLILRQWQESDHEPFAAMSADPEVMRYFPAPLSRDESDALIGRVRTKIDEQGWGLWACERREDGQFIGFVGLWPVPDGLPGGVDIEVGWRLAEAYWGHGYATEAGAESLRFAFENLAQEQVVSFTAIINKPSSAVMRRLGMSNLEQDFDHPKIDKASPVNRHVLYGITRNEWEETRSKRDTGLQSPDPHRSR